MNWQELEWEPFAPYAIPAIAFVVGWILGRKTSTGVAINRAAIRISKAIANQHKPS